jgi:transcriptional regulator with XRE-family HTH domain
MAITRERRCDVLLRDALGETLRDARNQQNRTLRDVSTAANVSLGYLSEVERGRKEASSELLASICDALDLELSDLLDTVSRTMRSDAPIASGTAQSNSSVVTNSTKPGLSNSNRARSGGLDLDPTLRIVLPYGSTRPGAPVG